MNIRKRRGIRSFRPSDERLESRLVMSGNTSVSAAVRALLTAADGGTPVRPNTPVLPLESPYATATFIDPTVNIVAGKQIRVGQKDYIAPSVTLNAKDGLIILGSSTTMQDDAQLIANPNKRSGLTGIVVGDNVVIGDGAAVRGPAVIGAKKGVATSIGAGALIDGAIISPGAFVGALARVGPGVTVPTGYRVLPGVNVTTNAQASIPSLGFVVKVTSSDAFPANAIKEIANSSALAIGYATLYEGNSADGGAASAGPIPSAVSAAGSTIFFGELNTVLGISAEPGSSRGVPFEPPIGVTPTFLIGGGLQPVAINLAYRFPARVIGNVAVQHQGPSEFAAALGGVTTVGRFALRTNGVTVRADEGQPIGIGSVASLGKNVSIHSPLGGVQGTTTTTVATTTTIVATSVTTKTSTISTATSNGTPTATPSTTTVTTTGVNALGQATTGTITTTIATKSANLGSVAIGRAFTAGNNAVILGSPTVLTIIGDGVVVGPGAVVNGSTIGNGALIGARSYISASSIPAGAVIPSGAIYVNNKFLGFVQW